MPDEGVPADEVAARLEVMRADDVRWRDGRAFSLVYHAGDDVLAVQQHAYRAFMTENALNTDAFPSLRATQAEVVVIASGCTAAPPRPAS